MTSIRLDARIFNPSWKVEQLLRDGGIEKAFANRPEEDGTFVIQVCDAEATKARAILWKCTQEIVRGGADSTSVMTPSL
ncbi:MAG: hypothetical protein PHH13_03655 [Candidatus Peribacteraceae bacterium]|nr:hypothetical protein [Candidatus Peribacteraceae bacterium]